jgi:S1-C subfamily serine protease
MLELHALASRPVLVAACSPNYATPWQMLPQTKSTATGFVVAPLSARRVLTNAHAVAGQIQVQLRKHGNAKKFHARVLAVGHEVQLTFFATGLGVDMYKHSTPNTQ